MNTRLAITVLVVLLIRSGYCENIESTPDSCYWSGTAPFCFPACPNNWETCAVCNDCCGLQYCVTGSHFYCCPTRSQCPTWPCVTEKYSVVLINNKQDD